MPYPKHEKQTIIVDGKEIEAIAPIIISASRVTDIPAFHTKWFLQQLKQGYVIKQNAYNAAQKTYISFNNAAFYVFWTKNALPMLKHLDEINKFCKNYYFLFTLNNYENEKLEKNVPPLDERINTFISLSKKIGKERVIWRFDPIIKTDITTYANLIDSAKYIGDKISSFTNRLIFSFVEINQYKKVSKNMSFRADLFKHDIASYQASLEEKKEFSFRLLELCKNWTKQNENAIEAFSCADPFLQTLGIPEGPCIDANLILSLCNNKSLHNFLQPTQMLFSNFSHLKDKGQRKDCGCVLSKDIGWYNSCKHFCTYCYANKSEDAVEKNFLHNKL